MNETAYLIALSRAKEIGASTLKTLIEHFGSPSNVFGADIKEIKSVPHIGEKRAKALEEAIRGFSLKNILSEIDSLRARNINILTYFDKDYPQQLKEIPSPPLVLYIKGEIRPEDRFAIAVVGSRRPTHYGHSVAEKLSEELSSMGLTIISGLARGIDTASHIASLRSGGRTIAVLGSGIDVPYPPENKGLMQRIIASGAVISEFPPESGPSKETFPQRNRIISGLSLGVLVVEASRDSGALITASHAIEQGREVFAIPGSIYSETSGGTNELIKKGAKIVTSAKDIVEELSPLLKGFIKVSKERVRAEVSSEEKAICDILSGEPVHVDEILKTSGLSAQKALALLLELELKGIVRQAEGKRFYLA